MPESTPCADCGAHVERSQGPGRPRMYCLECRRRRRQQPRRSGRPGAPVQCLTCCRWFHPQVSGGRPGPTPMYCSLYCRQWWNVETLRLRRWVAAWRERCRTCDRPTTPRGVTSGAGLGKLYCSRECQEYAAGGRSVLHDRCRVNYRDCTVCGSTYVSRKGNYPTCSEACRRQAKAANNRRKNAKRRGAKIGETFTIHDVAERDGWRCHLCRRKVSKALPGTHPRGPTIDHLVPIAAGGRDELGNVALAHRGCNCRRQDGGAAQLLLIGA